MSEIRLSGETLPISGSQFRQPMTRRQLLRTMAVGSAALAGAAALASCGGGSAPTQVTLYSTNWMWSAMPSKADQAKDPAMKAYADILKQWYDKNPGVTIKASTANIWDEQVLTNSIAAGTAPTWFPGDVLGSWNNQVIRAAFAKGLAADVTDLLNSYHTEQKIVSYARPLWQKYALNGKFYSAPNSFNPGGPTIFYRRDLLQQAGLPEPTADWTWNDLRTIAKALTKGDVKGIAMQSYGVDWVLSDHQFHWMTNIPTPKAGWHWHTDYTSLQSKWVSAANIYRGMFYQDGSILSDVTYGDGQVANAFGRGSVGMTCNDISFMLTAPTSPASCAQIAKRAGKPLDEMIGALPHPRGTDGSRPTTTTRLLIGQISFDPHLSRNPTALDKAFNFYDYMLLGDGYLKQHVATYEATKDLQQVYTDVIPLNGMTSFAGVPGTFTDAWGQKYSDMVRQMAQTPIFPDAGFYFPAEKTTLTNTAWQDAQSALGFSQKDPAGIFAHAQDVVNQQESSATSSVSQDAFLQAARKYYADLDTYWKQNDPTFYNGDYQTWHQKYIAPALS